MPDRSARAPTGAAEAAALPTLHAPHCFHATNLYLLADDKSGKATGGPGAETAIQELIGYKGGGFNEENVADIVENALKLLTDVQDSGDVR